jgi:hypothetical protein
MSWARLAEAGDYRAVVQRGLRVLSKLCDRQGCEAAMAVVLSLDGRDPLALCSRCAIRAFRRRLQPEDLWSRVRSHLDRGTATRAIRQYEIAGCSDHMRGLLLAVYGHDARQPVIHEIRALFAERITADECGVGMLHGQLENERRRHLERHEPAAAAAVFCKQSTDAQ